MNNITQKDKELILQIIKIWDKKVLETGDYNPFLNPHDCILCQEFLFKNDFMLDVGSPGCRKCPIVKISGSSCANNLALDSQVLQSSEFILTGLLLLAAASDIDVEKELL